MTDRRVRKSIATSNNPIFDQDLSKVKILNSGKYTDLCGSRVDVSVYDQLGKSCAILNRICETFVQKSRESYLREQFEVDCQ